MRLPDRTKVEITPAGDVLITQGDQSVRLEHGDLIRVIAELSTAWVNHPRPSDQR